MVTRYNPPSRKLFEPTIFFSYSKSSVKWVKRSSRVHLISNSITKGSRLGIVINDGSSKKGDDSIVIDFCFVRGCVEVKIFFKCKLKFYLNLKLIKMKMKSI